MNTEINCTADYTESLKTEIITKVDAYYRNLARSRADIRAGMVYLGIMFVLYVTGSMLFGWPAILFMGVFVVMSVLEFNKNLLRKKCLVAAKCPKTEQQAELFRQERHARKERALKKLDQQYSNNLPSQ